MTELPSALASRFQSYDKENENQALRCFILIKEVDVRMLKLMICRRADVVSHKLNRTTFMKDITKYAKSPKAS
jgi:hypothetical protein